MRNHISTLLIALLLFGGVAKSYPQSKTPTQQPVERNWKLTPANPAPEPENAQERALRHARGAAFDDSTHTKRRLDLPDPDRGKTITAIIHDRLFTKVLPLPVSDVDAVVVGSVVSFQPYFSNDRTGIYHEFVVSVERVFKDRSSGVVKGSPLTIIGHGGAINLPNGEVAEDFIPPRPETDLRVGRRYVLFLIYQPWTKAFLPYKSWQLRDGLAVPLFPEDRNEIYAGMNEVPFLQAVQNAVAEAER